MRYLQRPRVRWISRKTEKENVQRVFELPPPLMETWLSSAPPVFPLAATGGPASPVVPASDGAVPVVITITVDGSAEVSLVLGPGGDPGAAGACAPMAWVGLATVVECALGLELAPRYSCHMGGHAFVIAFDTSSLGGGPGMSTTSFRAGGPYALRGCRARGNGGGGSSVGGPSASAVAPPALPHPPAAPAVPTVKSR